MFLNNIQKREDDNCMIPEPIKVQAIDSRRIEIYWNMQILDGMKNENYTIVNNGKVCSVFQWNETEPWYKGTVYQKEQMRTTIYLNEELDINHLEDAYLQITGNICNIEGVRVDTAKKYGIIYNPYYTKFSKCNCGITVKSSESVPDECHEIAKKIIDSMMVKLDDVTSTMIKYGVELSIYAKEESAYEIPEHRMGYLVMNRPIEGYGGEWDNPACSISEMNVLRCKTGNYKTRYLDESILVHEFAHGIHLIGIEGLEDKTLANEIRSIYEKAKLAGKWPKTYAISNYEEYFATLTTIWFNVMAESADGSWDGTRGPVNTREELYEYDRDAYEFFKRIYPEINLPEPWNYSVDKFDIYGNVR